MSSLIFWMIASLLESVLQIFDEGEPQTVAMIDIWQRNCHLILLARNGARCDNSQRTNT